MCPPRQDTGLCFAPSGGVVVGCWASPAGWILDFRLINWEGARTVSVFCGGAGWPEVLTLQVASFRGTPPG